MRPAPADVAGQLERLTGGPLRDCHVIGGQHGVRHYRCELADGRLAFAKVAAEPAGPQPDPGGPAAGFEAEARGLGWLGEAHATGVPDVLGWDQSALVISWVRAERADRAAAGRFGRELARLHAAGADCFGAPWPGTIGSLPLPNQAAGAWPGWYARQRLLPYLGQAAGAGLLSAADVAVFEAVISEIETLAGPAEPPSRIHGDCWTGNVMWAGGRGVLIDPAAHGGHRETDLAMLALFGAPFLDQILAAYQQAAPLAAGWRERIPLHQLHPLLVHVCLFGAGYRPAALDAARRALSARNR